MKKEDQFKLAYQGALQMITASGAIIWQSFNSILAANAFLITAGGVMLRVLPNNKWAPSVLAISGLLICLAWYFSLKRNFSYYRYYFAWGRSIEKTALGPKLKMLFAGKTYAEGGKVMIPGVGPWQMEWSAKIFKVERLATAIIVVFGFFYALLLWLSVSGV